MAQETKFQCSGNCLNCSPAQRTYCASQHAYSNMKVLDALMSMLLNLQAEVKALSEKIQAMQAGDDMIFDPHDDTREEDAQEGGGAVE